MNRALEAKINPGLPYTKLALNDKVLHSAVIIREILLRGFLGTHCFDTFFTGSNCVLGQTLSPA